MAVRICMHVHSTVFKFTKQLGNYQGLGITGSRFRLILSAAMGTFTQIYGLELHTKSKTDRGVKFDGNYSAMDDDEKACSGFLEDCE